MKKIKWSFKTLFFKTVQSFMSWYSHITKTFYDITIVSCKGLNGGYVYRLKYSLS